MNKKQKWIVATIIAIIIIINVILILTLKPNLHLAIDSIFKDNTYKLIFTLVVGGITASKILPDITNYIEDGKKKVIIDLKDRKTSFEKDLAAMEKEMIDLDRSYEEAMKKFMETESERKENLTDDEKKAEYIDDIADELKEEMTVLINKISRSGTINLMIGMSLTAIAIIILTITIFTTVPNLNVKEPDSVAKYLLHMLPRLSVVLFIELFSFFFLKLYKRNIDEIKFFSSERTNILSKILALRIAITFGSKESIDKTIEALNSVDRNATIKKDETTIELEKMKIEGSNDSSLLEKMMSIAKLVKDK